MRMVPQWCVRIRASTDSSLWGNSVSIIGVRTGNAFRRGENLWVAQVQQGAVEDDLLREIAEESRQLEGE
jgi:hypothetical protein